MAVMADNTYLDFPLIALGRKARDLLFQALFEDKVIPSPDGFPRNWKGIQEIAKVQIGAHKDPTAAVISAWERKSPCPSVRDLMDALEKIDRFDVADDLKPLLFTDYNHYTSRCNGNSQVVIREMEDLEELLTIDDVNNLHSARQKYDAFLLYADEEEEFASLIVNKLEGEHGLKLCLRDRDLLGGTLFVHEAIMKLIEERCSSVIAIISSSLMNNPDSKFFASYSLYLQIGKKVKVVPCIYRLSSPPEQFRLIFCLHYPDRMANFWDKLAASVKSAERQPQSRPRAIQEPEKVLAICDEPNRAHASAPVLETPSLLEHICTPKKEEAPPSYYPKFSDTLSEDNCRESSDSKSKLLKNSWVWFRHHVVDRKKKRKKVVAS